MKIPKFTRDKQEIDKIKIPICCREGRDSCPHAPKRETKPKRKNIAV